MQGVLPHLREDGLRARDQEDEREALSHDRDVAGEPTGPIKNPDLDV